MAASSGVVTGQRRLADFAMVFGGLTALVVVLGAALIWGLEAALSAAIGAMLGLVLVAGSGAALRTATRMRTPEGGPQVILVGAMVRFAAYAAAFLVLSRIELPHRNSFGVGVVAVVVVGLTGAAVRTYRDRRLFWLDANATDGERTSL